MPTWSAAGYSTTWQSTLYILDCLINIDAGPKPELVTTDQARLPDRW
ncbi:hypothetical protein [Nonomuraea mesophila]|nr:hypothetical protein [Nonomuraea mesophila]